MKTKLALLLALTLGTITHSAPFKVRKGVKYTTAYTLRMVGIPSNSETNVMIEVDLVKITSVHLDAKAMCALAARTYESIAIEQGKNYTFYCKKDY